MRHSCDAEASAAALLCQAVIDLNLMGISQFHLVDMHFLIAVVAKGCMSYLELCSVHQYSPQTVIIIRKHLTNSH